MNADIKRFVTRTVGAAILGAAALLLFEADEAQAAVPDASQHATTTITQRPGHVAIQVEPPLVSRPLVWGPFSSPLFIVGD